MLCSLRYFSYFRYILKKVYQSKKVDTDKTQCSKMLFILRMRQLWLSTGGLQAIRVYLNKICRYRIVSILKANPLDIYEAMNQSVN